MESDNWVVQNLQNALETWNEKLAEIWQILTQSPEEFKGGAIWDVVVNIHGALQAIGYALLILFFVVGVVKTCGSFAEVKKPEHAVRMFIRFALSKGSITYGMELMVALFNIVQGIIGTIMDSAGFGEAEETVLPTEIVEAVEDCGFLESIPLWAVTLIGSLFITILSFIMIMSVYGGSSACIFMRQSLRSHCPLLQESPARTWARVLSKAMQPCVWRGRSLCWLVLSFPCLRHRRL